MMALDWGPSRPSPDLALAATGQVARDDGLRTAVLLSLFLDARARPEDPLPEAPAGGALGARGANADADRRGWVGDALAPVAGDRMGSRLWLLAREKQTEGVRARAEIYAREALAWLVADGLATGLDVAATWRGRGVLDLRVRIAPGPFDESFQVSL